MEDPFASLAGDHEPSESLKPSSSKSNSPFEELVENSRSRGVKKPVLYSISVAGIMVIALFLVGGIQSRNETLTSSDVNPSNIKSPDPTQEPLESSADSMDESPITDSPNIDNQNLYAPPLDLESFIEEITESTVKVECSVAEDSEYFDAGSGFLIDVSDLTGESTPELAIVTNHHVIEDCVDGGGLLFVGQGDEFSEVKVLGYDIPNDLALVEPGLIGIDPLPVSSDISVGQWVMTSGSPVGIESNVTFGQVTSTSTSSETGGSEQIASDAVIGPGNSGGPLVNRAGEAIGVNSAVFIDATGISVSVPVTYLCISILSCAS